MGKDKLVEKYSVCEPATNNIVMQYIPLLIALVCLIICYLLYKKIQTLNSQGDSIINLEKHFTNFIKQQTEINTNTAKKFNALATQMNQLNYVIQNNNTRKINDINSQMSPDKIQTKTVNKIDNNIEQPVVRELMPTIIIPSTDIKTENLPMPINTSMKKSVLIENSIDADIKNSKKKVINLETLQEEVLIEEASSDED